MSINTTPTLKLPQWTAEEHPSFLAEINPAWMTIDSAFADLKAKQEGQEADITEATTTANAAQTASNENAQAIVSTNNRITALNKEVVQVILPLTINSAYSTMITAAALTLTYNNFILRAAVSLTFAKTVNVNIPNHAIICTAANIPITFTQFRMPITLCVDNINGDNTFNVGLLVKGTGEIEVESPINTTFTIDSPNAGYGCFPVQVVENIQTAKAKAGMQMMDDVAYITA